MQNQLNSVERHIASDVKLPWFRRCFSYLLPIKLLSLTSEYSGHVEVWLINGKVCLDTANANYSFGSLHKVFRKSFRITDLKKFNPSSLLLLGLGGGSVPSILRNELKLNSLITAVEIDPAMIELSRLGGLEKWGNIQVVCANAINYCAEQSNGLKYDCIVIDIYIDNKIPKEFAHKEVLQNVKNMLAPGGRIYMNVIPSENQPVYDFILSEFESWKGELTAYTIQRYNVVLVWQDNAAYTDR